MEAVALVWVVKNTTVSGIRTGFLKRHIPQRKTACRCYNQGRAQRKETPASDDAASAGPADLAVVKRPFTSDGR